MTALHHGGFMNRLLIVGILITSTMPLSAQGQQPDPAKLKADAQKVVSVISGDKAKAQTYCQITQVGEQMNQAVQAKDQKKFDELAQKLPEMEKNLGPEYLGLVESSEGEPNAKRWPRDRVDLR
jgi:cytochrome c